MRECPPRPAPRDADVIVVGAGLAGLVAARQLVAARREVLVLEARDRVGGRTANASIGAGKVVEMGGQWVGPTQDRLLALAGELRIETFPTYYEGRNLLDLGGKQRRYKGTIPRLAPHVLFDLDRARRKLGKAARRVPADAPWTARNAVELDSQTLATWVRKAARTKKARSLLEIATGTVMGTGTAELSLLWMLSYVSAAGDFDALIDTEGGAQQDRFVGGSQLISQRLAEELGDGVQLSAPVRRIAQDGGGLVVDADGVSARAQRVIVAVPPPLAARISFSPSLGGRRDQLMQRMAHGALTKCAAVYPEPFWRAEGLTGQAVTDRGPVVDDLRQFPAGWIARRAARLHRRRRGDPPRPPLRGGAPPDRAGQLCSALRARGGAARHLPRDGLGRGGMEPRRPRLLVRPGGARPVRRGAAPADRAGSLGGCRDRDRLVRIHGRRGPLRGASGRGGPRCGRMAPMSVVPAVDDEVAFAGAARIAEMVRDGKVSPSELVELYLGRIAALEPKLNAYRVVLADGARADAKRAEERLAAGDDAPLLGVPVAVKDNVDYAGEVTTDGTAAYGEPAAEDGLVVRRLREAGATIIGKTNLPELAIYGFTESPTWGDTRNPWDPSRTCGGSSGGSGAATAAGLCAIAHATDGAGSIRYPAANCGLFGLKPQRNRISLWPDREHWYGLSVCGLRQPDCHGHRPVPRRDRAVPRRATSRRLLRSIGRSSRRRERRHASCGSPAPPRRSCRGCQRPTR